MDGLPSFILDNPNFWLVTAGTVLLSISSALVGTFTFLKKKSLIGDAVAHSVLPGICLAFIISGNKDPLWIIIGAFISGWISILSIDFITNNSRIKEDTAIGLVLSVFFGFGIMLLVAIQHSGNPNQSGLNNFLFGNAASLIGKDLITFSALSILLVITVFIFYKEFKLMTFDRQYARTIGLPLKLMEFILSTLTVLAIVAGIQAIGVVLMAAMLITPAAAAKFWTDRLFYMLILAAVFASLSSFAGAVISFMAPAMPTGPWIVVVISLIAMLSFFIAPGKGIINKWWRKRQNQLKILEENILKTFYLLGESGAEAQKGRSIEDLNRRRPWKKAVLIKGLSRLKNQGFLVFRNGHWYLTKIGLSKGQRVVRLHRLWELYLTEYLKIAPDHVHEDAETIEHVITLELEKSIMNKLGFPELDPHQSKIPYTN
ncbi:metal ABC transporter permease [Hyphobacterium sp. CCMP332]|nr:metal ABC transporter permease [Hyphobacterium sp. CCMP332]